MPNVDKHPPFRELMLNKHKAYASGHGSTCIECTDELISWLAHNLADVQNVLTFFLIPVRSRIEQFFVNGHQDNLAQWWYE